MGAPVDSPAAQVQPLRCPSKGTVASPAAGQENPLPIKRGQYLRFERSELTKRGAFSIPRSRQSPANGLCSHRLQSPATRGARIFGLLLTFTAIVPHGCSAEEAEAGRRTCRMWTRARKTWRQWAT